MLRNPQRLRHWAALLLFVWLFGVGSGVANACLLPRAQLHSTVLAPHRHAASDHQDSMAKANCQDFCDKTTASMPAPKPSLDDVQSHAAVSTAMATAAPAPAFVPAQTWMPVGHGALAPPIRIAYLRLAL